MIDNVFNTVMIFEAFLTLKVDKILKKEFDSPICSTFVTSVEQRAWRCREERLVFSVD